MGIKKNINRIILVCFWLLAGTGLIVLLIAAVNSRSHQVCDGYDININGNGTGKWFIDKNDIINVLTENKSVSIKNKPIKSFNLGAIEAKLEKESWVKDAELFFDNEGVLKVKVTEREPVARLFTTTGQSFYIDSTGKKLPLSSKLSVKLPVFTSYPYAGKKAGTTEKKLLRDIKDMSLYLSKNPFWMAQVSQIDITPSKEFEIVPTIGNHVIEFGDADDIDQKFHRLLIFYKQVLAKTGMDKYERIKVQFAQQVIGVKKQSSNN
jgi:cell division protein FtsQ